MTSEAIIREPAPSVDLAIPPGPWDADVWLIEKPQRLETSGSTECAVRTCERPAGTADGDWPQPSDVLCLAQRRRRHKDPKARGLSVEDFIEYQATASPIRLPRGARTRVTHLPPIDFTRVSPRLARELRWLTARNVNRGTGRDVEALNQLLRKCIAIGAANGYESILEFPTDPDDPHWVCPYCRDRAHRHRARHVVPK